MKRTRKWSFVAQEAVRLAGLGMKPPAIAKQLGVNRSTVTRWMAAGKISRPKRGVGRRKRGRSEPAASKGSAAEWAVDIRKAFDLDATDDQLVTLAQNALEMSRDRTVAPHTRLAAAGRFQALVRQLALVARGDGRGQKPAAEVPATNPPERRRNPVVPRSTADPRSLLMAVK